jgi:hypothetical protein
MRVESATKKRSGLGIVAVSKTSAGTMLARNSGAKFALKVIDCLFL